MERKQVQVETPGEGRRVRERREDALKRQSLMNEMESVAVEPAVIFNKVSM